MEVSRLILVLQILGSTWSNAEHRYSDTGLEQIGIDGVTFPPPTKSDRYVDSCFGNGIPCARVSPGTAGLPVGTTASSISAPHPDVSNLLTENGFDAAAWFSQYASSPYRPRSIQGNIYFNMTAPSTTAKPENVSEHIEHMLNVTEDRQRTALAGPTESPLIEKEIVSMLLRYGQHHKYVLKTILRGLKLLRDSSISDIRHCVREALFKADELQPSMPHTPTQSAVSELDEKKHIVKALLTQPNYMEFCVHKTVQRNMRKQVYDSLMTEMSSIIKNRQTKQLMALPNTVSSTIRIDDLEEPLISTSAGSVEEMEGSTVPPTTASSNSELQESTTTPNTESLFGDTQSTQTSVDSMEITLSREDMNTALNKEMLASEFSHQITKPYKQYTSTMPNKIRSKIPLIYHHGTISIAPGFNYVPRPYLSIFTVGEIDPEIMAKKSVPIHYPEIRRAHLVNEKIHSTTTEKADLNTAIDIRDNEDPTHQGAEVPKQVETLRTVKKMLTDDEFQLPGPFAMERLRVKRSPTKISLNVQNMEDQKDDSDMTDEDTLSTENSRAPKEYLLPLMISEAIPVISVPGEIPDLGKEINVIKEFAEPASTVEPPIVLKVQRVPTHVDTSEFWNTRKDDYVQESSSVHSTQDSDEANIQGFLDDLRTTEGSLMRESKMLKEETVTDSLADSSQQTITLTESFLETTTTTQGNSITEVLLREQVRESSNKSESVSSSEEEEYNFKSTEKALGELVDRALTQNYAITHITEDSVQGVTQVATETSAASEETATNVTPESLEYSTAGTSDEGTESATTTIVDKNDLHVSDESLAVSTQITAEPETSSDATDFVLAETTGFSHDVLDIIQKPVHHTISATTSSEGSKTSEGTTWDPDFDFVVEEFSSSHIAKDDIPDEYMDYSLALLGELAKPMTEFTAKSTMLTPGRPVSSDIMNGTKTLSSTAKEAEGGSTEGNIDFQPTSVVTRVDKETENVETSPASFQKEADQKEPSGLQQSTAVPRSRRQAKHRELPSGFLKLLKDKGLNTEALNHRRGSSANGNQIPMSPQKFSKSRTQKILLSLSDKRRKGFDEEAENETDDDNSVGDDASIMELIDVNRVSHILEDKKQ